MGQQGQDRLRGDADIRWADHFGLADRDAAGELRQVLGETQAQDGRLDIGEVAGGVQRVCPAQALAQGLDIGCLPGEAVGGELVCVDQGCVRLAVPGDQLRDGVTGGFQQLFGERHGGAAKVQQRSRVLGVWHGCAVS
jgi:hypothetical protein